MGPLATALAQQALDPCLRRGDGEFPFASALKTHEIPPSRPNREANTEINTLVVPAQAGLRRQEAEANIRNANGPKGKPQERRVTQ
jgi:hypothetical protein